MTVNFYPLVQALIALAAAVVSAAAPLAVALIAKRMKVANDADLVNKVDVAAKAGAGAAYKFAAAHEGGLSNVSVHNAALATGVNYVVQAMPDLLKELGITPEKLRSMVSARLGALLASDPAVSVTGQILQSDSAGSKEGESVPLKGKPVTVPPVEQTANESVPQSGTIAPLSNP